MRECIFCSGKANTREHLWPEWLGKLFLQRASKIELQIGQRPPKPFRALVTSRCVCKSCNEGWMSTLEGYAKPVMTPLMNDLSFRLDNVQQWLVSIWSVKTAMVFECVNRHADRFYSEHDRRTLLAGTPPPDTAVWIGRHAHSNLVDGVARRLYGSKTASNPFAEGYVTSLVFFRLVIQVFTLRLKPEFKGRSVRLNIKPGPWNQSLAQIWPIKRRFAKWPPSLSFSNSGTSFEELSKRFLPSR